MDPSLETPLYRQLSSRLEDAIRKGVLKRGDRLPPTRRLSADLNTARRTVVKAYDELLSKGYLEGKVGAGTTVSRNLPEAVTAPPSMVRVPEHDPSISESKLSSFGQGLANLRSVDSNSAQPFADSFGYRPHEFLPLKQWRNAILRHCDPGQRSMADFVDPCGYVPLREAIAQYLARTRGVICHPDQVMVFSEPRRALCQTIRILIDAGDFVAVENPGAPAVKELLMAQGANLLHVSLDEDGLSCRSLERLGDVPKLVYLTPSCQNPTGIVASIERRVELLAWASRNQALIIEDALDSDYRYGNYCVASLQGLCTANVIYFYSFQKILFPLSNISVVIVPPYLVQAFRAAVSLLEGQGSLLEQCALRDFIIDGQLDAHVRKTRKLLQERRQVLLHSLATCFRQAVWFAPRSAGTHIMVRFRAEFDEETLLACAEQCKFPMMSMRANYSGDAPGNEFLISFAGLEQASLRASFEHFAALAAQCEAERNNRDFDESIRLDCSPD